MIEYVERERPEERKLEVRVKYGDLEAFFSGSPDEVLRGIMGFMSRIAPTIGPISRLTLSIDVSSLAEAVEGLIAITPEGLAVMPIVIPRLTDREAILLHLVKAYLGYQLGRLECDSMTVSELAEVTGSKKSAIAARLSELVGGGWVSRVGRGDYRITTVGIKMFLDTALPRIRERILSEHL